MKLGIDISIGEDSRPQRKLILKILKKFEENNKFAIEHFPTEEEND